MEALYRDVAGLDIHKKSVVACVRRINPQGQVTEEVERFGTMTSDLLCLSDWMAQRQVTHVAMESTGVYWKPVWNILEGSFQLQLVNARELKQVPGRKSDVKDCQWIAHLLQCGLLRSSFVPDRPQRELRDLTRHRTQLVGEQTRVCNRVQKILEDANIKLGSVASDVLGVSGRLMLQALVQGERDPVRLAEYAKGKLRQKVDQLKLALVGHFTDHHRFMLQQLLDHLGCVERQIAQFDERIAEMMRPFCPPETMARLKQVPGLDRRAIENVLAETGTNMEQFPSDAHLSSWTGVSPGNEESAGKRKRGKTTKGNRWLRSTLCQAAWAASRKKNSYLAAKYRRLAARRGRKRAAMAVGHQLLVIVYHLLKYDRTYEDLGANYFDKLNSAGLQRYLVKRLERLGYEVTLKPTDKAA